MTQLTAEDINTMSPHEIEQARIEGRLANIGIGQHPVPTDRQLTNAEVSTLYSERRYQDIEDARQRGQLDNILNPTTEGN